MEPGAKQPQEGAGYGYNYGGNYAGYSAIGYGTEGDPSTNQIQRTFQDYLLILRERIWYIVVVFLVVFSSSLVFTLSDTKIYQSSTTLQIFRRDVSPMQNGQVMEWDNRSVEDLNTQVKIIESLTVIDGVAQRLQGEDRRAFLAPYAKPDADAAFISDKLLKNRKVVPQRLTLVIAVQYQHPDRVVAAKVANLFAEVYLQQNQNLRAGYVQKAAGELQTQVDEQKKKVEELQLKLQDYKEKNKTTSFDQRRDIDTETLKLLNIEAARADSVLQNAKTRIDQINDYRTRGVDLTTLSFIASDKQIADLMQKRSEQQIEVAKLSKGYREKHPTMMAAQNTLTQTERELARAIQVVCQQAESEYQSALVNQRLAQRKLEDQKAASLELERAAVEYTRLERDLKVQEVMLQSIAARTSETTIATKFDAEGARVVDVAVASPENKPISPNVPLNLGLGLVGGLGLGLAFAFFVAFIDDRVKSSFDIEGVVGLPLIGIIPQIKRMEQADKAQIVATNADRQVAEAFLTLHSSLRLKDESKNAKCILTTSTIPGEGKSFTTTNLALTFASHGEKVIVIDCDLRKPNVHKSFRLENLKGVIDVAAGKIGLDEAIVRNVHPNLDVLPAGGRAKNPTQILNSKGFEVMLSDLRKRYDRVFVDTPPLAAVSDALIVLPLVDGSIFTIFFNKVRRKAAQFAAKKLLEANVPNFGAVLNGLNLAVSGYYYAQYYDKSYKDYYVVMAKNDNEVEK